MREVTVLITACGNVYMPGITDSIRKEKVLTPENEEALKKVLADFAASF